MMESAEEIEPEEPPDTVVFQDTAVGLTQPSDAPDEDESTEDQSVPLPDHEALSHDTPVGLFRAPVVGEDDTPTVELPSVDEDKNED